MARKSTLIASGISLYQQTGKELFGRYRMTAGIALESDKENHMAFFGEYVPTEDAPSNENRYWVVALMVRQGKRRLTYAKFYPADKQGKANRQFRKIQRDTVLPVYRTQR